ncbi:hypothetical protein [Clostridium estertheticum]|uniref:hypothetical protein n=1 Tax=Clostridium estertheticum TaxID=238834 RepID=UPI001CF214F8|nr:hypothetical protein [Clostridium estertheticum]MCB2361592.1 hypothetical protein [Clostridium estertheticum]
MENKKMTIANFNIVFGESEEPLLNYFHTAIMPAFKNQFVRTRGNIEYTFLKVDVIEVGEDDYALTGIIVKKTMLEIRSKFDEAENLIETNEVYPTAPYSLFVIYLKNHRMTLVKNQKGSPDLKSFSATFKMMLNSYIREENIRRKENEEKALPIPDINIVGIPMKASIEEALKSVSKINKLTLKFYPLNGDLDFSGLFEGLTTDLRKKVGSKTGSVVLNSPTSISGVTDVIAEAQGTVEPVFKVTFENRSKGTITNGTLSESMDIVIDKDSVARELEQIANKAKKFESILTVSEGNRKIFEEKKSNIIPFVSRR